MKKTKVQPDVSSRSVRVAIRSLLGWEALLWAGVAALVLSTVWVIVRTYTPVPKWDYWVEISWLQSYYEGRWHIADLWRQHNEHRILFPRLFFLVDLLVFKGVGIFLAASIVLLQAGHTWIFVRELQLSKQLSGHVRRIAIAITIALLFSGADMDNLTWTFQVSFILVFFAATFALYSLVRYGERPAPGWLAACIGAAFVASYSLASGVLVWPVLLLMGWTSKLRWRSLLLITASAAITAMAYGTGYQSVSFHTNISDSIRQPLQLLVYVANYLVLPLSKLNHEAGIWVGSATLTALVVATARLLPRPELPRLARLAIGVMVFVTLNAFVTGLGRMSLGPAEGAMRYATPVCVFWACAFYVVLLANGNSPATETRNAAAIAVALTCLITVILPIHIEQRTLFTGLITSWTDGRSALESGVLAEEWVRPLYPIPAAIFGPAGVDLLRAHRLSFFAYPTTRMGEALFPGRELASQDSCSGIWDAADIIAQGEIASGWAWDKRADRAPKLILIADNAGAVRGVGRFTRSREDVADLFHNGRMQAGGWFGFAQAGGSQPYRAYAILADGKACPLRSVSEIRKSTAIIFRHGDWVIDSNKDDRWEPSDRVLSFGLDGDLPVAGDWDGSGVIRAGVFRNGQWLLDMNNSGRWDDGDLQVSFGAPGDVPVVGDWGHTGVTKLGVFRNGQWFLDWSGTRQFSSARSFAFGVSGDIPVVGDWDGSGKIRVGVFRRGEWLLDMNGAFALSAGTRKGLFGLPGDQPVVGDWNGLGVTRIGVFRNGQWIFDSNGNLQWDPSDRVFAFGLPGDIAVSCH
jgi:hypothetical protein